MAHVTLVTALVLISSFSSTNPANKLQSEQYTSRIKEKVYIKLSI